MSTQRIAALIDDASLRGWPLPEPDGEGDKEERGRTLIVAGSRELAGAAILAGTAALRAGAGKLTIATAASVAAGVALAVPEARVLGWPETAVGDVDAAGVRNIEMTAAGFDAVLIGPGCRDEHACVALAEALLPLVRHAAVVLDASAMALARRQRFTQRVLLTPHAGEMAHLCDTDKHIVQQDPPRAAAEAARRWNAIVALKGPATVIANAQGGLWLHEASVPGLAASGSGDVLAGLIVGLAARGASLEQAAVWGVALHARSGMRLAQRLGPIGTLARELAAEVPALMQSLTG